MIKVDTIMIKHRDEKDTLDFTANDKLNNLFILIIQK